MSDLTRNLIDAIISGKATDIETTFQATMADKISDAMEERKVSVAQGMFKESIEELDESLIDAYKEHKSFSDKVSHLNTPHKKLTGAGYKTTDKLDPNKAESPITYHKAGVGSIRVSHSGTSQGSSFNTQVSKFGMTNASRGNSSDAPANPVREELDD